MLLGDVVAKTGAHTGPMDVLEQAVVALVGCIEILADAVDVLQEHLDAAQRPQLMVAPEPAPEPEPESASGSGPDRELNAADVPAQLAVLTKQVRQLTKTVNKLSKKKR
jgi:hypothetical protein